MLPQVEPSPIIGRLGGGLEEIARDYTIEPLAKEFGPRVHEALRKHGKDRQRKSKLTPVLTVWLVIAMALRRELAYPNILDWLVSALRVLGWDVPRHSVQDGAISHARKRLGVDIFWTLFGASRELACPLEPDFHGRVTTAIDGSTQTMPDTPANVEAFGKPAASRGHAAFPQVRVTAMIQTAVRGVFDARYGPCRGKRTGERTQALSLIEENARPGFLFLLDRGLTGMPIFHAISDGGAEYLARVPETFKLKRIRKSRLPDGSYAW